jgi:hypothetical protein
MRHAYLTAGTWRGSVVVTDHAGNQSARSYTVNAAPAAPPATVPAPAVDTTPPRLTVTAAHLQAAAHAGVVVLHAGCLEACTLTARGTLTARHRRYVLAGARGAALPGAPVTLRLRLDAATRRALRAAKRATVTVTVRAADADGNTSDKTVRLIAH